MPIQDRPIAMSTLEERIERLEATPQRLLLDQAEEIVSGVIDALSGTPGLRVVDERLADQIGLRSPARCDWSIFARLPHCAYSTPSMLTSTSFACKPAAAAPILLQRFPGAHLRSPAHLAPGQPEHRNYRR